MHAGLLLFIAILVSTIMLVVNSEDYVQRVGVLIVTDQWISTDPSYNITEFRDAFFGLRKDVAISSDAPDIKILLALGYREQIVSVNVVIERLDYALWGDRCRSLRHGLSEEQEIFWQLRITMFVCHINTQLACWGIAAVIHIGRIRQKIRPLSE
jgi:hypothetical protein